MFALGEKEFYFCREDVFKPTYDTLKISYSTITQ